MTPVLSGVLLLDKPPSISSAGALNRVKRTMGATKIGHAGTLDPFATGLLVCLLGKATRLADFAQGGEKTYTGVILFGTVTDTDDITGRVVRTSDEIPTFAEIKKASSALLGKVSQLPPSVSAIKVGGVRAYELARAGEAVALAPREVTINEFSLAEAGERSVSFKIRCSKGTYIRAIARDLGELLGSGACLESLRREASLPYSVADATTVEEVGPERIRPWRTLFGPAVPRISLAPHEIDQFSRGDERALREVVRREDLGDLDASVVLYGMEDGPELGLLLRRESAWRFGPFIEPLP